MIKSLQHLLRATLHYYYPQYCLGCGNDPIPGNTLVCSRCLHQLPISRFFELAGNPVEQVFNARLPIQNAAALYYFTKDSLVQELLLQLKYRNNPRAGLLLGRMMGLALTAAERFNGIDLLIPVPLNKTKEFRRGYNQSAILCQGIASTWQRPLLTNAMNRMKFTHTQTQRNRVDRWLNMQGVFSINNPQQLANKHILLVDDVITTGATIESCGNCLLTIPGVQLSVVAAAYTF